jgi:hypothetical protein
MPTLTATRGGRGGMNFGGHGGGLGLNFSYEQNEDEQLQTQLLKAELANMQTKDAGSAEVSKEAAEMSKKYLGEWNSGLDKAGGMYNSAISDISDARTAVKGAYADVSKNMGDMSADMKGAWDEMKTEFGDIRGDLISGAKEDMGNRKELTRNFMELTRGDEEGASGRAMEDVAAQAEAGRKAEAMRMSGLGVDPTSGRSRSMMRTSRNQEALDKAFVGNKARMAEKDRIAGITAQGLELIDPNKAINTAKGIQGMENDLLTSRSNLEVNRANVQGNLAQTQGRLATASGNIAGGYATNIAAPRGEMGASQMGVSQATRGAGTATSTVTGGSGRTNDFASAKSFGARLRQQHYGS